MSLSSCVKVKNINFNLQYP